MVGALGDGESEATVQGRIASATWQLLERLVEHHCYDVPKPKAHDGPFRVVTCSAPVQPADSVKEWVTRQRRTWFHVIEDVSDNQEDCITIEAIKRAVCQHFRISKIALISHRRTKNLTVPRQISFYLCRELTPKSFPDIAARHGGRDHTTAIHGCRKIELLCERHQEWRSLVDEVRQKIVGGSSREKDQRIARADQEASPTFGAQGHPGSPVTSPDAETVAG